MALATTNLMTLLEDFGDGIRNGNVEALGQRLAANVVWQGVREDLVCHNRDEVLDILREQAARGYSVRQLELIDAGDRVVMVVRAPEITEVAGIDLGGQLFQVFTFEGGKIVRMHDYLTRGEALEAAGLDDGPAWR